MTNFEVIIGIEIHLELNTKTKMFSSAPVDFNAKANTTVSPIDLAYPGTLPTVNKQAVIYALMLAKTLKMKVNKTLLFDRKNYFYPDLPKGYQITQQEFPIGFDGKLFISNNKEVLIERIHLEEDTAKSIHQGDLTLLNYNRAGVPLIEIVTEPVLNSADEVVQYVETIKQIALALGISDAKMEEGSLRVDVNISLRPWAQERLGTKVEIKNMNSTSNIKKAIENEIKSQVSDLINNKKIEQVTKRFDESSQKNVVMRKKAEAIDYKYFREPNIPPIYLKDEFINSIELPELPNEKKQRYFLEGIEEEYIIKLMADLNKSKIFDNINFNDKNLLAKIFFAEVVSYANAKNLKLQDLDINYEQLVVAITKMQKGNISGKHLKKIILLLIETSETTEEIVEKNNMKQISDPIELTKIVKEIIEENKDFIEENTDRKERIIKQLMGMVMKKTKAQANPILTNEILTKELMK